LWQQKAGHTAPDFLVVWVSLLLVLTGLHIVAIAFILTTLIFSQVCDISCYSISEKDTFPITMRRKIYAGVK